MKDEVDNVTNMSNAHEMSTNRHFQSTWPNLALSDTTAGYAQARPLSHNFAKRVCMLIEGTNINNNETLDGECI